jgi:nucleoside-diphosphate-sugar epimerase
LGSGSGASGAGVWQSRFVRTCAIAGGSGFLGRHLACRRAAHGIAVRSLDVVPARTSAGVDGILGDVRDSSRAWELPSAADAVVRRVAWNQKALGLVRRMS